MTLERRQHGVVVRHGAGVEPARRQLEPAPLQRQPVRVVPVGRREREVLVEALPVEARVAAAAAARDHPRALLEAPPVVQRVAALHLVGAGGRAPQEAGGERERKGHGGRKLTGFVTACSRRRPAPRGRNSWAAAPAPAPRMVSCGPMPARSPEAPRSALADGFRALRHRDFRLFFGGQLVSLIGTWMQAVAQGWLMHRLTSSAFMLGLLSFDQFAPVLPLALWAGVIADHSARRTLLLWTQSLLLAQAVALAIVVSAGVVQPWMVLALAVVYGIVNTFDLPARQTFIIDMTGREDLPNGIALNSAAFNAARILRPAVAGVLVATLGEAGCFWLNALSFMAVIVSLSLIRGGRTPRGEATGADPAGAAVTGAATAPGGLADALPSRRPRPRLGA